MQVEACKILKRLDLKVFVTDANGEFACKPWVDDFDVVDTYDIQGHLEIARVGKASKLNIAGVACIATDCHETVAALSTELGLPGITLSLSREIGNKIAVRKRLAKLEITQPEFYTRNEIEADYAWVFFSLSAPAFYEKKSIYVNGMFNNFAIGEENKMDYNAEKGIYEKALLIKQGFTNFQYVIADSNGKIDEENAIDGNFFQTEDNYFVLVYYKENNQRYDRIIGKGIANSVDITN
mgnify:CR=1 FL=1